MRLSRHPAVVCPSEEERRRLVSLHRYDLLDPTPSPRLDALTRLGANLFEVQLCRVTVVGQHDVVCRSAGGPLITSAVWPRDQALCELALGREKTFVPTASVLKEASVGGTKSVLPFYAAAVLRDPEGVPVGTLHVADSVRRRLTVQRRHALLELARMCEEELFASAQHVPIAATPGWLRDPTTGCISAPQLNQEAQKSAITRLPRLVRVDVENLQQVETRHGWEGVERVLRALATRFSETLGADTAVARTRWNAFVFVVPAHWNIDDAQVADQLAFLAQHLTRPIDLGTQRFSPRIVMGASHAAEPDPDPERTMLEVNRITRESRAQGMKVLVQTEAMVERRRAQSRMLHRLDHAIRNRLLSVVVQPKFDMDLRPVGGEVLARWIDEELGFIPPSDFIPLAEENGLIRSLGWCITESTCELLESAKAAGHRLPPLAVNVSTPQLTAFGFAGDLLETLEVYGVSPGEFDIEITESVFSDDMAKTRATLERLSTAGMSIYLDDYGTGYSSLAYLKSLPLSHLKVDRAFVMELQRDRGDAAIVDATIAMAHALGMKVVAEGVEEESQWWLLRRLGCDVIQGYWSGRPMPFDDFVEVCQLERAACAPEG